MDGGTLNRGCCVIIVEWNFDADASLQPLPKFQYLELSHGGSKIVCMVSTVVRCSN